MTPQERMQNIQFGQQFRHYKGRIYTFLYIARHSETEEWLVVYQNTKGDIWVRPYDMFFETITVNGQMIKRFCAIESKE